MALLAAGLAGAARAAELPWEGTFFVKLGNHPPQNLTGGGIATVDVAPFSEHLEALKLAGGIAGSFTVPITDPDVTVNVMSYRIGAALGSGTLGPFSTSAPLTQRLLPVSGFWRFCIILPGCALDFSIPLTENGTRGFGLGGLVTIGGTGPLQVDMQGSPWTLGSGSLLVETDEGGFGSRVAQGFIHGPASGTSSTAQPGGVIQLIAPIQVSTIGVPGSIEKLALFGTLRIRFVPEPGLLLLLGSGAVGLALLARHRSGQRGG